MSAKIYRLADGAEGLFIKNERFNTTSVSFNFYLPLAADTAAASLAGALEAESLILMSDIRGLLENKDDPDSLIKKVYVSDIPALVKQGIISGGMIPKIECCKDAIRRGVKKVFITDGRVSHSILIELLSDEGSGTMFV